MMTTKKKTAIETFRERVQNELDLANHEAASARRTLEELADPQLVFHEGMVPDDVNYGGFVQRFRVYDRGGAGNSETYDIEFVGEQNDAEMTTIRIIGTVELDAFLNYLQAFGNSR